ncbi:MAG: hypothetical protein LBE31_03115 [Deltaproteobacteria bacterium]|nr:hypothetical protein [Deltaproteobacteria bacterium]
MIIKLNPTYFVKILQPFLKISSISLYNLYGYLEYREEIDKKLELTVDWLEGWFETTFNELKIKYDINFNPKYYRKGLILQHSHADLPDKEQYLPDNMAIYIFIDDDVILTRLGEGFLKHCKWENKRSKPNLRLVKSIPTNKI